MNANEIRVLVELARDEFSPEDLYRGFGSIGQATGLDRKTVRRACRSLKRRGYAEFASGLFNDEGEVAGSGYRATFEGVEIRWLLDDSLVRASNCPEERGPRAP